MAQNYKPPVNSRAAKKPATPAPQGGRRRRARKEHSKDENKTYLVGAVCDTLPGTRFMVKIERSKGLEPLVIECSLKTMFKARNIKIIKGDTVELEIDPMDPSLKGVIINRQ
jgi:translation initiation factor IF-1